VLIQFCKIKLIKYEMFNSALSRK